jgi:hypothetical protein
MAPRTGQVQSAGRNLLAGARLSRDQDRRPTSRNQADDLDYLLNLGAFPYQALPPPFSAEGFAAEPAAALEKISNMFIINKMSLVFGDPSAFQAIWSGRHHSSESAGFRETLYDSVQILPAIR